MKAFLLTLACSVLSMIASAQDKSFCKEVLRKSFAKMEAVYTDSSDLYMHYAITNKNASDKKLLSDDVKIYKTNNLFIMTSGVSSYYSDRSNAFMVVSSQKKLYRVDRQASGKNNAAQMTLFRQALIDSLVIKECKTQENGFLKISVTLPERLSARGKVKYIDYVVDPVSYALKECLIYYTASHTLIYSSYKFIEMDKKIITTFPDSISSLFFTSNSKLTSKYSGYTYIDLRQPKSN